MVYDNENDLHLPCILCNTSSQKHELLFNKASKHNKLFYSIFIIAFSAPLNNITEMVICVSKHYISKSVSKHYISKSYNLNKHVQNENQNQIAFQPNSVHVPCSEFARIRF